LIEINNLCHAGLSRICLRGLDKPAPAGSKPGASRNQWFFMNVWIPAFAGMTSCKATLNTLLRLKARDFNHPRKKHQNLMWLTSIRTCLGTE
jgi:hypothetical protein